MRMVKAWLLGLFFLAAADGFVPSSRLAPPVADFSFDHFRSQQHPSSRASVSRSTTLSCTPVIRITDKTNNFKLYSNGKAVSNESSKNDEPTLTTTLLSASMLIVIDIAVRRILQKAAISFPSSLAGCGALFASLLLLPGGESMFKALTPGAAILAKWLPVFFVPSLVTLPLASGFGSATELAKVLAVTVGGFYFTLLTTAGSVIAVRKLFASTTDIETVDSDADRAAELETLPEQGNPVPPPKPFSEDLITKLRGFTALSGLTALVACYTNYAHSAPVASIFMLGTTLHNFVFGARLPNKFTKIVHPLVTCTTLTWIVATAYAAATGSTFKSVLRTYKTGVLSPLSSGAGDILLFLLGPAVVSLAVSMYDRRQLMRENLKELVAAIGVSSLGGLFGTAMAVRLLQIISPYARLSLLSRNITSPLAMAIAAILGADVSLAVSMVVVTGLVGANFGASILDSFGIKDPVARGLGMGAAAHGLGTAAIVNEKDAFPFSAISMSLTASACTVLVSIPIVKRLVIQLALG